MLQPQSSVILKEIFASAMAGLSNFLLGYSFTVVVYMAPPTDAASVALQSTAGSLSLFTSIIGTFLFSYIADNVGRRKCLLIIYINYVIAGLIFSIFRTVPSLYLSRILVGVASGGRPVAILYVSEVTQKNRRGTYLTSSLLLVLFGALCTLTTQYFNTSLLVSGITTLIGVVGCLGMCFLPETKYWYMIKKMKEEAKESVLWFDSSKSDEIIDKELDDIKTENTGKGSTTVFQILRQWSHLKQFLMAIFLFSCRSGCGLEPIGVYTEEFYMSLNIKYDPKKITLLQGVLEFILGILCTVVISKFKRRTMLYFSASLLIPSVSVLIISHCFINYVNEYAPWIVLLSAYIYVCITSAFLFPLVYIVAVEVVSRSNEHRNTIYNISYSLMTLYSALFTAIFPTLLSSFDINVTLIIFLVSNLLLVFAVKFLLTESANKELHSCVTVPESNANEENNDVRL